MHSHLSIRWRGLLWTGEIEDAMDALRWLLNRGKLLYALILQRLMKANNLLAKNCTARGVSLIYKLPVFRD